MSSNNSNKVRQQDAQAMIADWEPAFLTVGIGASAGGLKALMGLLQHLPEDSGMAFVVVVHLSPDYPSAAAELLQRKSLMPVCQVTGMTLLEANHVYVIPPGHNLTSIDSHLRLTQLEERLQRAPIDHFLSSLAKSHGEKATGVLLSGTGSDGVAGLGRIREHGGCALVQDPAEAEFNGMPQSAIMAGVVDRILPVKELAGDLVRLANMQRKLDVPDQDDELSGGLKKSYDRILEIVHMRTGHDFARYKVSTILRRIRRQMQLMQMTSLEAYLPRLLDAPDEAQNLFNDMVITVTQFFRDPKVFAHIERVVVPRLFTGKKENDKVRLWVVGCASGEEAYTYAMLLMEHAEQLDYKCEVQIFASDVHEGSLKRARDGLYPSSITEDISEQRLERFFIKEPDGYRIKLELREKVLFAPHNLLRDPPFCNIDLISCRNLMIYLQRSIQAEVLQVFRYALNAEGFLVLGTSETIEKPELFKPLEKEHCIFMRSATDTLPRRFPVLPGSAIPRSKGSAQPPRAAAGLSYGALHQEIVERFAPPSILINSDFEIVHFSENVGHFFAQPGGEPSSNIFKRVREELRVEMRDLLFLVKKEKQSAKSKPVCLVIDGRERFVILRAKAPGDREFDGYVVVMFDEFDTDAEARRQEVIRGQLTDHELESELDEAKRRLQQVIEQYETAQEEMRAYNEELQSTNEELRSTMEEFETSKEELQSMNEELLTLNMENRHKVEELSQLSNDLQNLLSSTEIATLFLDRQQRIFRFTQPVKQLFSIRASDRGRLISDFSHNLEAVDLESDARVVLQNLQTIEREVRSKDGKWFLLRMLPYRSMDDRIEGVVVTLVDITQMKEAAAALLHHEQELQELNDNLEQRVMDGTRKIRDLASHLTLSEQRERKRISHILHDDLQQMLASIQMRFFLLQQKAHISASQVREIDDDLIRAIKITRDLAIDLSPPVLESEGLLEMINWLKTKMHEAHQLEIKIVSEKNFALKQEDLRVLLFTIVRELLFNVVKHSGQQHAEVHLSMTDSHLCVEVKDSGKGFSSDANDHFRACGGLGLANIYERMRLHGGSIEVQSNKGCGTSVKVYMPKLLK